MNIFIVGWISFGLFFLIFIVAHSFKETFKKDCSVDCDCC